MSRPTLTPAIEEQIVAALAADQSVHITLPPSAYRADGSILVHRDNLYGVRAQRHLYRRLIGPLPREVFLRRICDDELCINPYHYVPRRSSRPRPDHCPNGHEYTAENTLTDGRYRCRTCFERLVARRRGNGTGNPNPADINRAKTQCVHGHPFTPDNTYITEWNGSTRRRCRQCAIEYALAWREKQQQLHERKAS